MAATTEIMRQRWATGDAIGDAKPYQTVNIRRGMFHRSYDSTPWNWSDVGATIASSNNAAPWQATWKAVSEWRELPGILEVHLEQSLENNGITTATITLENIAYTQEVGPGGPYHFIQRGYYAPLRGYSRPGFPGWMEGMQNEWYEFITPNAQVTVTQGYGDATTRTFTGLIDDIDFTSHPDRMVITARDFGQVLTDQHVFGHVKDPKLKDPITFIDRRQAEKLKKVGYSPGAGTEDDNAHVAAMITDLDSSTYWRSRAYEGSNATDWCQIHIPQGRYSTFYLWNYYSGMEGYLSIYVRPRTDGQPCRFGGVEVPDNSWVNIGLGTVPGALGGKPYIKFWQNMPNDRGYYHTFGEDANGLPLELECGPDTAIRVHFRGLHISGTTRKYYAGVRRMIAIQRKLTAEARKNHFVLVDDVSDIIRVCLRWAGFKLWEVENTGVRLKKRLVVDRSMTLMDVIKKVADGTDFMFYMGDPPADDFEEDMGVPIFRHMGPVRDEASEFNIWEDDLLTGIQAKYSEETLATIIRARGAPVPEEDEDHSAINNKHVHYTYVPPWAGGLSGIIKHVIHNDPQLESVEDCKWACYYIALQEALASYTGVIEFPAWPGVELDDHLGLIDTGTGLITRLWVSNRSSTFHAGEQTSWKMTCGGSFVDTPDVRGVVEAINADVRNTE